MYSYTLDMGVWVPSLRRAELGLGFQVNNFPQHFAVPFVRTCTPLHSQLHASGNCK